MDHSSSNQGGLNQMMPFGFRGFVPINHRSRDSWGHVSTRRRVVVATIYL